jgi:hypothetical protein
MKLENIVGTGLVELMNRAVRSLLLAFRAGVWLYLVRSQTFPHILSSVRETDLDDFNSANKFDEIPHKYFLIE